MYTKYLSLYAPALAEFAPSFTECVVSGKDIPSRASDSVDSVRLEAFAQTIPIQEERSAFYSFVKELCRRRVVEPFGVEGASAHTQAVICLANVVSAITRMENRDQWIINNHLPNVLPPLSWTINSITLILILEGLWKSGVIESSRERMLKTMNQVFPGYSLDQARKRMGRDEITEAAIADLKTVLDKAIEMVNEFEDLKDK